MAEVYSTKNGGAEVYGDSDKPNAFFADIKKVAGFFQAAGFIGLIGLLVAAVLGGAAGDGHVSGFNLVMQSYTFGYIFFLTLSLGCLGVQLLAGMLKATWAISILRVAEAGAANLKWLAVLGLPLVASMWFGDAMGFHLYNWTSPEGKADPILAGKAFYLNPTAVTIRYVLCFAVWFYWNNYLAYGIRGTVAQDRSLDMEQAQYRVNVAAPGFLFFGISITFFYTDFVMSLDPHWFSTIYGVWWGAVGIGGAIALGTALTMAFHNRKPVEGIVSPGMTKDLGNMLFGMTMVWGYFSISQALIYWSGNLPEYVTFYYSRFKGSFAFLGFLIVVGQFFIPFLLLLSGRTKRTPWMLGAVATWILCVRVVDVWYQITPFFGRQMTDFGAIAVDLAAWAFVGGVWAALFAAEYVKHSPVVLFDTRLQEKKLEGAH